MAPPDQLVRVGARPDGTLALGKNIPGRGAWLCARSLRCFDLAVRRKAFSRALRREISHEAVATLRARFADRGRMGEHDDIDDRSVAGERT